VATRSIEHASFVIERTFDAPVARVFTAWSDRAAKARWFAPGNDEYSLDFRIGGIETNRGEHEGDIYTYRAVFHEIVRDDRIVFAYDMDKNDARISVSLVTVQLTPDGDRTAMTYTEYDAYFDGADTPAMREHGTRELIDALDASLRERATA
jgi:uncharacterized protein YndB with AHSA1/START domain